MQEYSVKVTLPDGQVMAVTASESDTLEAVADRFKDYYEDDIILGIVNGRLRELNKEIKSDCELSFVTTADRDGRRTYRRSVVLLLQRAIYDVYGSMTQLHVMHSLGEGYYCQLEKAVECADSQQEKYNEDTDQGSRENSEKSVTEHDIDMIVCSMYSFVEKDLPITKHSAKTQYAEQLFKEKGLHDKERLLHYRRSSRVNLYELDGVVDYFYGFMAPSTGMLKYFDIVPYESGFVLLFPGAHSRSVEPLVTSNKLFHTLDDSREWSKMLGIGTIGSLNDAIAAGRGQEIMLLQEALMEQKIGNLAAQIASDDKKKFVMIAGPSSSGKTSFANRLSIQLIAKGRKPHPLSLDDYYVDRELCPKNPDGSFDFECLESIDVKLFNEDSLNVTDAASLVPGFQIYEDGVKDGWIIGADVHAELTSNSVEQSPLVYFSSEATQSWCGFFWSNQLSAMVAAAPEGMEIGITTWPSENPQKSNFLKPSQFFAVSRDAGENEAEAVKVVNYLLNSEDANKILLGERGVPASSVVASAIAPLQDETAQVVTKYVNDVVTPNCSAISPAIPDGANEVYDYYNQLVDKILYGQMTAQEAAEDLFKMGNQIMSR